MLFHPYFRIENLELMSQYGGEAWKSHNATLVQMLEAAQKQLTQLRKQIQEINWQRKTEQVEAGSKLKQLEEK